MIHPARPFAVSVCICTRNRPDDLTRAIESVLAVRDEVHQLIVSDDSTSSATRDLVAERYPDRVTFVEGPRRGLCANRNTAIARVTGTHILFIDDDATLDADFVPQIRNAYARSEHPDRLIVTGLEQNALHGLVHPKALDFFGRQQRVYRPGDRMESIVINAAVFPTSLFDEIRFNENLIYGLDEVDVSTRAVAIGYRIELCSTAINCHFPSAINRDLYSRYLEASRLYVTFRHHLITERKPAKAAFYAILGPLKLLARNTRLAPRRAIPDSFATFRAALRYVSSTPGR